MALSLLLDSPEGPVIGLEDRVTALNDALHARKDDLRDLDTLKSWHARLLSLAGAKTPGTISSALALLSTLVDLCPFDFLQFIAQRTFDVAVAKLRKDESPVVLGATAVLVRAATKRLAHPSSPPDALLPLARNAQRLVQALCEVVSQCGSSLRLPFATATVTGLEALHGLITHFGQQLRSTWKKVDEVTVQLLHHPDPDVSSAAARTFALASFLFDSEKPTPCGGLSLPTCHLLVKTANAIHLLLDAHLPQVVGTSHP